MCYNSTVPWHSLQMGGKTLRLALHLLTHSVLIAAFSSVQSVSRVQLFATPWITACQASLSITPFGKGCIGRNDAKAETPVLWPPRVKSWLIGKDFDAGRDWEQEEKGTTEDEMAGWHHWLSEWTPGVGDGQGGLACCDSWGCKESDMTERLNWTELNAYAIQCGYSVSNLSKPIFESACFITEVF